MTTTGTLYGQLKLALIGLVLSSAAGVAIALTVPVAPPTAPPTTPTQVKAMPAPGAAPIADRYAIKDVLHLDGPLTHGSYAWNESGVPDGAVVVTIDLKAETLSVFRAGHEIGVAAILFGTGDKPTPLGRHEVRWKKADHTSSLYDAPMPFTLNLTGDGVAIHGSEVEWGAATHGCIGVPVDFARLLFEQVEVGDPVIVTRGRMLQLAGTGGALPVESSMSKTAERTDPKLWERVKKKVTAGARGGHPGEWSARKAQLAVAEYKKSGGGYKGEKSVDNHLAQWTEEEWGTKSGKDSSETGERYLPKRARDALTREEYERTTAKKRTDTRKGKQFSAQPTDVAEKTARYRETGKGDGAAPSKSELMAEARERGVEGRSKMTKAELARALAA